MRKRLGGPLPAGKGWHATAHQRLGSASYGISVKDRQTRFWKTRCSSTQKTTGKGLKTTAEKLELCKGQRKHSQLPRSFTLGWSQEPYLTEARQDHSAAQDPLASERISISRV